MGNLGNPGINYHMLLKQILKKHVAKDVNWIQWAQNRAYKQTFVNIIITFFNVCHPEVFNTYVNIQ